MECIGMSFKINATIHSIGLSLLSSSTKPKDILSFYNSMLSYLDYEINLFQEASNLTNLHSESGIDKVVKYVMSTFAYPLQILNHTLPSWSLTGYSSSINATNLVPAVVARDHDIKIVTRGSYTAIDTFFNAPKVELECANRLYLENNYFNTSTLVINNRTLTAQELAHISTNSLEKCPIREMKLALSINFNKSHSESDVREYIAGIGDNFRESLVAQASTLSRNKADIVFMLERNGANFEKCQTDFTPKVIDVLCSEVAHFDFMSI